MLGASLVAHWLGIRPPMQETRVRALVWEDPTCRGATKPACHSYWACALEPARHNKWAREPRPHALQQEKPPQWEAHAPQRRVGPVHRNWGKPTHSNIEDPRQPKKKKMEHTWETELRGPGMVKQHPKDQLLGCGLQRPYSLATSYQMTAGPFLTWRHSPGKIKSGY